MPGNADPNENAYENANENASFFEPTVQPMYGVMFPL